MIKFNQTYNKKVKTHQNSKISKTMEHKRVQAPLSTIRPEMVKPKPTPQKVAQPIIKPAAPVSSVKTIRLHHHDKLELCEKHKQYKVAYEPVSGQQMCNQCLFEIQAVKAESQGEP